MLNAWRDLAFTEPSLAGVAVRLHALIARSPYPERFVTALLANFPSPDGPGSGGTGPDWALDAGEPAANAGSWAELVCCGHPPPMLLRGGSAAFVTAYAAPPLGLLDTIVTRLEEHGGDHGCDDILLLLVTMRLSAGA